MMRSLTRPFTLPPPQPKLTRYKYLADQTPSLPPIIFDIIDGLPITQVDPELYPLLMPLLRERERALKEWRNQPASRSIEAAINHILNYRYADDPDRLQPRFQKSLRPFNPTLSPTELAVSINMAMRGELSEIDPRHYRQIIRELQRLKNEAVIEGDYALAERAVTTSRSLLSFTSQNQYHSMASAKVESLADHLKTKARDRDELIERSFENVLEAERRRDSELRAIERQNERELREFDKQFATDPPPELRKFSPELLQLRVRERYMVQAGRYLEAKEARKEAEILEKRESEEQKRRWNQQLQFQRSELVKKQEEKMYVRRVNADNQIAQMKRVADVEMEHQEKAIQHVEQHYSGARLVQRFMGHGRAEGILPRLKMANVDPKAVAFRQRALINTVVYTKTPARSARV